jgi:hypothetical protein
MGFFNKNAPERTQRLINERNEQLETEWRAKQPQSSIPGLTKAELDDVINNGSISREALARVLGT